jgi:hypothetical protein
MYEHVMLVPNNPGHPEQKDHRDIAFSHYFFDLQQRLLHVFPITTHTDRPQCYHTASKPGATQTYARQAQLPSRHTSTANSIRLSAVWTPALLDTDIRTCVHTYI